jgi:hypothetical protein
MRHGDYNVYFREPRGEIMRAGDLADLRARLRTLASRGLAGFVIPHHIGYLAGYRGICWEDYTPEFSPVVEIMSMHGAAESDEAPFPYLHDMGPRDGQGTMHHGLGLGHVFGVIGSTDHHAAHPGSYGCGLAAVWAGELSSSGIWEGLATRRSYALTGDRIALAFSVNGHPMGAVVPATDERQIEVAVRGGAALDYVELLRDNRPIQRWLPDLALAREAAGQVKVLLEVGWGRKDELVAWDVSLEVVDGVLLSVEPRFRGRDVLAPGAAEAQSLAFTAWQRVGETEVHFTTQTWGNPTTVSAATQGVCLEIRGDAKTRIRARINGHDVRVGLGELIDGARAGYLGGLVTPAYRFGRAVVEREYAVCRSFVDHRSADHRDWYTVRVRQKNGQWAWSSPIWMGSG